MAVRLRQLHAERQPQPGDIVFPSHLDVHNLRSRVIRPAAKAAGAERVSPYAFRRTCASLVFDNGCNIKQVQEWLGHHDASSTLRVHPPR